MVVVETKKETHPLQYSPCYEYCSSLSLVYTLAVTANYSTGGDGVCLLATSHTTHNVIDIFHIMHGFLSVNLEQATASFQSLICFPHITG